jgi:hypothetical protein
MKRVVGLGFFHAAAVLLDLPTHIVFAGGAVVFPTRSDGGDLDATLAYLLPPPRDPRSAEDEPLTVLVTGPPAVTPRAPSAARPC